ncbi:hypothetical protein [Ralstonia pickettii]|jgi:hypothetical protein|uniref:hypothetical protein n=1 Tax=Ralstonia pickettii TaxID=329 RepID=UPI0015FD5E28|nr:hypothetical protein [Ralstonia pickettii]MBB0022646.1 hypothetical protein [Ralstonia pickettii]MBB0033203.1 hypothetical protein [Ralstonia pickettii]MBB0096268.1 hypothetical protein [Ralstonia pickettii]MBB0105671.1 hypothetical protein [Ralstonia pickettii]MBB0127315.1 hypothetical protein [Ralstonia pickettii]
MAKEDKNWSGVAHIRIRLDILNSPAWRVLSFTARALYMDMRASLRSTNNGDINAALGTLTHKGWNSRTTILKAIGELITLGFIAKTRQGLGGPTNGSCSLYRFTDVPTYEQRKVGVSGSKATFEYLAFKTVGEAEQALREWAENEAKPKARKSK